MSAPTDVVCAHEALRQTNQADVAAPNALFGGRRFNPAIPAMIVTGRRATKMSQGAAEEEDEKRLLSVLMQGAL